MEKLLKIFNIIKSLIDEDEDQDKTVNLNGVEKTIIILCFEIFSTKLYFKVLGHNNQNKKVTSE